MLLIVIEFLKSKLGKYTFIAIFICLILIGIGGLRKEINNLKENNIELTKQNKELTTANDSYKTALSQLNAINGQLSNSIKSQNESIVQYEKNAQEASIKAQTLLAQANKASTNYATLNKRISDILASKNNPCDNANEILSDYIKLESQGDSKWKIS